ncbi:MAG: D-alanyl-D-alanine carboxypeptidase [Alphaproteobacteria bacterium]
MVAAWRNATGLGVVPGLILLAGLLVPLPAAAKYASIVVDAYDGRVVHATNADTRNYPASLTKIMTLFMIFEALDEGTLKIDQKLPVSARAAGQAPSKLGLTKDSTITVDNAIKALVTKSANDVATVVAEALGGTEIAFAQAMTAKARSIGMSRTTFRNASGLPNRGQLSTARDMAMLARTMLENFPHHYHYFSIKSFTYGKRTYDNHNKLLGRYDGADGIKTGYIRASGFNLVASVERDGTRLIGVVFGGKTQRSRDLHMASLLNKSWDKASSRAFAAARPQPKPQPPVGMGPTLEPARELALLQPGGGSGAWAIQVGAFSAFGTAHAAASTAVNRLASLPATTAIEITPLRTRGTVVYRARLTGIDELSARTQCRQVRRQGNSGAIVTPTGLEQLAGLAN